METTLSEFMSENRLNDGERNVPTDINNQETCTDKMPNPSHTEGNNIVSSKQYTNDLSKSPNDTDNVATFKKPTVLLDLKRSLAVNKSSKISPITDTCTVENDDCYSEPVRKTEETFKSFPYIEPPWGGMPKENYKLEVLKSGVIVETILLDKQSFHVVGRLPFCHLSLAHPSISRYHAVLQYRFEEDEENPKGFYIYDLGSTHGTFWNGSRIKPNVYVRIQGGHMIRFGCSQRKYILQAPPGDEEEESRYSVTELKEMRASQIEKQREEEKLKASIEEKESDGIDWGMGEDADEETDLQENPYASITDENLVLEDPKRTLRGWFEREGYDLHYQAEEKGFGQFLCWVDLPTEDIVGHSTRAEALVKGKKKEAVVQCALEACKILDKFGLLRQANHEARKRKTRNWEAEDYYDSDEDNFLDRTGSVEMKRAQRMRLAGKLEEKAETYDSLLEKHKEVTKRISRLSISISNWQNANTAKTETNEEDELDAFMLSLNSFALTKSDIAKMKLELQNLRKEEANLIKLLNLTQPANLPSPSCRNVTRQAKHQANTIEHTMQNESAETTKIHGSLVSLARRKKEKQRINRHTVSNTLPITIADTSVETGVMEEVDSDDNGELNSDLSYASSHKEDTELFRSTGTTVIKSAPSKKHKEQQDVETQVSKRHEREQHKIYCDQDVYADNYSMWIPPSDQAGDGKTSLNEKYGY